MENKRFSKGQSVLCISNLYSALTSGKEYVVVACVPDWVVVQNDRGEQYDYPTMCFIPAPLNNAGTVCLPVGANPVVVENEHVYAFDVDDTLVMWGKWDEPGPKKIRIVDPYDSSIVYLTPNTRHVKLLQQMHGRGRHILVWSQSGAKWAETVLAALGLTSFVHTILTKPSGYVDDLPVTAWMQNHIYLGAGESK